MVIDKNVDVMNLNDILLSDSLSFYIDHLCELLYSDLTDGIDHGFGTVAICRDIAVAVKMRDFFNFDYPFMADRSKASAE